MSNSIFKRTVISALVCAMLSGYGTQALAGTDIADSPMAVINQAKSNIMFTLDNSAGNDVDSLFPTFNGMYYETGVNPATTTIYNLNGFWNIYPNLPGRPNGLLLGALNNPDPKWWRALYYGYNASFYNPATTYNPWLGTDSAGVAFGNATPSAVRLYPYSTSSATYDLTTSVDYVAASYLNSAGTSCNNTGCTSLRGYMSRLFPASYYMWNDLNGNGVMDANEGVLYSIVPGNNTYPSGRTYAAELQNFANWFQYYRTPFLASKGAIGVSVSVMNAAKVGFMDLRDIQSPVTDMGVAANLKSFRDKVYNLALTGQMDNGPAYRQPLHERMQSLWNYYNRPANATSPVAPIEAVCQQNFNILVSPGYTNEESPWRNDYSGNTPTAISTQDADGALGVPYADTYSDTLADWSAYYYAQPLRTDLATGKVPLAQGSHETNRNLHMTTYVMSPGALPVLSVANPGNSLANAQTAALYPPNNTVFSWPQPTFVGQSTVDDLWHAAINGRGQFVNTPNIADGLSTIVDDILSRSGSAAAVAVANAHITSIENSSFATSYSSGTWTGNLNAYPINLVTGLPDENSPIWSSSAQEQLDLRTPASRMIATYSGSAGIQFQPTSASTATKLSTAQQTSMNTPTKTDGDKVVAFIRGDTSYEGSLYRVRPHLLGDIVNAEPFFSGPPTANYADAGYLTPTTGFKAANASRTKVVYQGGNDGMLHVFSAATGAELWGYVPSFILPQLNGLTKASGFTHKYFVDATPVAGDVDFKNTDGANGSGTDWRTVLVGGVGKGGRGYYALDVSNPVPATEAALASQVLWEFPNSSNAATYGASVGYTFAKPILVKTASAGWVALVTSGYNNGTDTGGNGQGYLFVLNARTGAVLKAISTGVGTSAAPSGLSQISAYVDNSDVDNTVDYVYGGDLNGNVWRFDLTGTVSSWGVKKVAALVDGSGTAQPITTTPELAKFSTNAGFKRVIYVGTGQYLGNSDVTATIGAQSMYALVDDMSTTPLISPLRSSLQAQTFPTSSSTTRTASTSTVDYGVKKGWYIDMPGANERISTDPMLGQSILTFVSNTPSTDACTPGGSSWINFLDFKTGGRADDPVVFSSMNLGNVLGSRPVLIKLPSGAVKALVRQSDAVTTVYAQPVTTPISGIRRISWREIPDN